ncbi:phosphoglycolate phosphatase [Aquibium oceanicum]|uniref:phosphoglycolate phosphatase n=1 Tax=Aquibium oceanicum TaxID=1670800 RepID=A0A1L3SZH3_9HYPH|nr:phosphoglycolate phosphatase [Aquibium oceanicum]APH74761.1 phosphoglycolate phosphatase [Aquibium oceanicum]
MSDAPLLVGRPDGWPKAVLFDLDGTLVDSAPDIAAATNELMAQHGLPAHLLADVRAMIGNGVAKLVERAFAARGRPLEGGALDDAVAEMMPIYGRHLTRLTTVLPGARESLAALSAAGLKLAVVSNKPMPFTRAVVDHYGFSPFLAAVQGAEPGIAKKPAPDMLFAALARMDVAAGQALMVGDSAADARSARAAGIAVALVRGGYTPEAPDALGADHVLVSLQDLPTALGTLPAQT